MKTMKYLAVIALFGWILWEHATDKRYYGNDVYDKWTPFNAFKSQEECEEIIRKAAEYELKYPPPPSDLHIRSVCFPDYFALDQAARNDLT